MPGPQRTLPPDAIRTRPPVFAPESKIAARYRALGGAPALGDPIERSPGVSWIMASSAIVYDPHTDAAYEIHGAIFALWRSLGGTSLGTPCTDELTTPDGIGRYNHFADGTMSIYWSPSTGAHLSYGDIRARWAQLGWERSYLGYPTSHETDFTEGGRATEFEHGGIYWWPDTGAIDLRDVVVHYTGLHCFGETDWDQGSDADEPYVVFGLATPQAAWSARTRIYDDVDGGESFPDLLELYRGRPYGLAVTTTVMEHDYGDPAAAQAAVQEVVAAAHQAGVAALGTIPYVGPLLSLAAEKFLTQYVPAAAAAIADVLNFGDDTIGSGLVTFTGRDLVLLAARTPNADLHGIGWKRDSPLLSGGGASYKAYFGVIPA